jgi:beta-glucosidase
VKSVIFLGPDALQPTGEIAPNVASGLGDRGSSGTNPPYAVSFMKGLTDKLQPLGITVTASASVADANKADIVIIPVTMAHEDEGEAFDNGHDRIDLGLNANHPIHWGSFKPSAFIKQAAAINPRVIVLLAVGSAIVMEDWIDSAQGIVQTFYPGQEGGNAVAKLLTGEINFSGKLPFTVATDAGDYPIFDNKSSTTIVEYLHGYRRIEDAHKTPRFWFGFGKSYTTYEYSNLVIPCSNGITDQGQLTVQVTVTNTGAMAGTEIVQAYIGGFPAGPRRPPKELKAFTRVDVAAGQSQVVQLSVAAKDMAYWDQTAHQWVVQSGQHTVFVGPSADPAALKSATFTITPATSGAP